MKKGGTKNKGKEIHVRAKTREAQTEKWTYVLRR